MKFLKYISDKIISIIIYFVSCIFIIVLLDAVNTSLMVIFIIITLMVITSLFILSINYFKKRMFYNRLIYNTHNLDKKYLVLETLKRPNSYEESIIFDILYDINKSMNDNVNGYKDYLSCYKEFLEIWIHEIKIPISSGLLLYHNHQDIYDKKMLSILKRLDNYIDLVLYYVRSEDMEKDFLISEVLVKDIIKSVGVHNKDELFENNISFYVDICNISVFTDKKWMEFILNQIINNSIKYKKNKDCIIKISCFENDNNVYLEIYDNGIGINDEDISRVFDKSFTGINGRGRLKSTGMGLYIVKKLCQKLGHSVYIESEVNVYTKVVIVFGINKMYKF